MNRKLLVITGVAGIVALGLILAQQAKPTPQTPPSGRPRITWTPAVLETTVLRGTKESLLVQVKADGQLLNVTIFVVPEISRLLSVPATGNGTMFPGRAYQIQVSINANQSVPPGTYQGTIHVRSGPATIPSTLPVSIQVIPPSSNIVPPGISSPSPDRVTKTPSGQGVVKDEILLTLKPGTPAPDDRIKQIALSTNGVILGSIPETLSYQLQYNVPDLHALESIRLSLTNMPDVRSAVFQWIGGPLLTPNDPRYDSWDENNPGGNNWGLEYIKAPSAWDLQTGSLSVVVAVLDGDFYENHEDLRNNIILPVQRIRSSRFKGHGTHVAGIIGAEGNNGVGVAGLAWRSSLRLYDVSTLTVGQLKESMIKAAQDGARIANLSLGVVSCPPILGIFRCQVPATEALETATQSSSTLADAIQWARDNGKDILWVFAAGNEGRDVKFQSPANLTKDFPQDTITVASIGPNGSLSSSSNFGGLVTVAAPGEDILSTLPHSCFSFDLFCSDYGTLSGTSQAAPHVSGLAALVRTEHPTFSATEIKQCIFVASQVFGKPVLGQTFKVISAPEAVTCSRTCLSGIFPIPGVPQPGDTAFPQNVVIPSLVSPASSFQPLDALCHVSFWFRQFPTIGIQNPSFNGIPNLQIVVHTCDVVDLFFFAQDDGYIWIQPDLGFNVSILSGNTQRIQFQACLNAIDKPVTERTLPITIRNSVGTQSIAGSLIVKP